MEDKEKEVNKNENNIPKELDEEFNKYKIFLANVEILACTLIILGYGILIQAAKSDKVEIIEKSKGLKITEDPATLTKVAYNYILGAMVLFYVVAVKRAEQRRIELNLGIEVTQVQNNFDAIAMAYGISVISNSIRSVAAINIDNISSTTEILV